MIVNFFPNFVELYLVDSSTCTSPLYGHRSEICARENSLWDKSHENVLGTDTWILHENTRYL